MSALLEVYRRAVEELGTDDLVLIHRRDADKARITVHRRERFIADLPDYAERFAVSARQNWAEETARGEGGVAFFWLITINPDLSGTTECVRTRLAPVGHA